MSIPTFDIVIERLASIDIHLDTRNPFVRIVGALWPSISKLLVSENQNLNRTNNEIGKIDHVSLNSPAKITRHAIGESDLLAIVNRLSILEREFFAMQAESLKNDQQIASADEPEARAKGKAVRK